MEGQVVTRSSIVSNRLRHGGKGEIAALFAKLLDLKKSEAFQVTTKNQTNATAIRYALRKIATQEGLFLGWDRNEDHTALYLWINTEKKA